MASNKKTPDFDSYHRSMAEELNAVKDRVRNLIQDAHWQTDGEWKEAALRSVLRKHAPSSIIVGRGFVVAEQGVSSQIDVLLVDGNKPVLFRDGDLVFVTPDAVRAIIEVKTTLDSGICDAIEKITKNERMCYTHGRPVDIWTGLFVYSGDKNRPKEVLAEAGRAWKATRLPISCIAYGPDLLVTHIGHRTADELACGKNVLVSRCVPALAFSYFVGSMLSYLSDGNNSVARYAWFPPDSSFVDQFYFWLGDSEPKELSEDPSMVEVQKDRE